MPFRPPAGRDAISRLKGDAALLSPGQFFLAVLSVPPFEELQGNLESRFEKRQRARARSRQAAAELPGGGGASCALPRRSKGGRCGAIWDGALSRQRAHAHLNPARRLAPPGCPPARVADGSRVLSRQNLVVIFTSPSKVEVRPARRRVEGSDCFRSGSVPLRNNLLGHRTSVPSRRLHRRQRGRRAARRPQAISFRFAFQWPPCPPICLREGWCRRSQRNI